MGGVDIFFRSKGSIVLDLSKEFREDRGRKSCAWREGLGLERGFFEEVGEFGRVF